MGNAFCRALRLSNAMRQVAFAILGTLILVFGVELWDLLIALEVKELSLSRVRVVSLDVTSRRNSYVGRRPGGSRSAAASAPRRGGRRRADRRARASPSARVAGGESPSVKLRFDVREIFFFPASRRSASGRRGQNPAHNIGHDIGIGTYVHKRPARREPRHANAIPCCVAPISRTNTQENEGKPRFHASIVVGVGAASRRRRLTAGMSGGCCRTSRSRRMVSSRGLATTPRARSRHVRWRGAYQARTLLARCAQAGRRVHFRVAYPASSTGKSTATAIR